MELCRVPFFLFSSFSWNASDWTPCSTSCGPGTQTRQVNCTSSSNGETVDSRKCGDKGLEDKRKCHKPCYLWNITKWSSCTKPCGGGLQTRKVQCVNGSAGVPVSYNYCGKKRPVTRQTCNEQSCYAWKISNFTKCSRTCGGGIQYRDVKCQVERYPNRIAYVAHYYCQGKSPARARSCNQTPCFRWNITEWSTCSRPCGTGLQTRTVKCIDLFHNQAVSSSACGKKPVERRSCTVKRCNNWTTSNWTSCSVDCGGGTQIRDVSCRKASNGQILASSYCSPGVPARRRECNMKPCYHWQISDWSNCSASCGGGLQTRQADCKVNSTGAVVYSGYCGSVRPDDTRRCNEVHCPAEWMVGNWSEVDLFSSSIHGVFPSLFYLPLSISVSHIHFLIIPVLSRCAPSLFIFYCIFIITCSQCSRTCGRSVRTRVVSCFDSTGKRSVFCDGDTRPQATTLCDVTPCPTKGKRPSNVFVFS